jgi:hypothetical protein
MIASKRPKRRLHYHSFEHFPSAFSARAQEKALSGALLAQASPLCGSGMQLLLPKLLSKLSPRLSKLLEHGAVCTTAAGRAVAREAPADKRRIAAALGAERLMVGGW